MSLKSSNSAMHTGIQMCNEYGSLGRSSSFRTLSTDVVISPIYASPTLYQQNMRAVFPNHVVSRLSKSLALLKIVCASTVATDTQYIYIFEIFQGKTHVNCRSIQVILYLLNLDEWKYDVRKHFIRQL